MVWKGPGLYEIIPYQVPTLSINSWGGGTDPGEPVKLYARSKPPTKTDNSVWEVALVSGSGDSAQYIIINARSGYFLTATAEDKVTSVEHKSPSDPSVLWTIKEAFTNGYQVYNINSVNSSLGQLNIRGSGNTSGTEVIAYPISSTDNTKFYFDQVS